jgi:beta-lactamase class A
MAQQVTRDRLAAAFPPPARVAAKSGGLVGLVRNEVGVIDYGNGRRFFAAVFTRRISHSAAPAQINTAIGQAAAHAVAQLEQESR